MFDEYIERVKESFGEETARNIIANGFYVVSVSSNDIANTYYLFSARMYLNISDYTDLLNALASDFYEVSRFLIIEMHS